MMSQETNLKHLTMDELLERTEHMMQANDKLLIIAKALIYLGVGASAGMIFTYAFISQSMNLMFLISIIVVIPLLVNVCIVAPRGKRGILRIKELIAEIDTRERQARNSESPES